MIVARIFRIDSVVETPSEYLGRIPSVETDKRTDLESDTFDDDVWNARERGDELSSQSTKLNLHIPRG